MAAVSLKQQKQGELIASETIEGVAQAIAENFQPEKIIFFGSYASGTPTPDSDLDFLVEFEQPTFDNYKNLAFSLEKLFGLHVDLVTSDSLSNHVRPYIEKEVLWYEA